MPEQPWYPWCKDCYFLDKYLLKQHKWTVDVGLLINCCNTCWHQQPQQWCELGSKVLLRIVSHVSLANIYYSLEAICTVGL